MTRFACPGSNTSVLLRAVTSTTMYFLVLVRLLRCGRPLAPVLAKASLTRALINRTCILPDTNDLLLTHSALNDVREELKAITASGAEQTAANVMGISPSHPSFLLTSPLLFSRLSPRGYPRLTISTCTAFGGRPSWCSAGSGLWKHCIAPIRGQQRQVEAWCRKRPVRVIAATCLTIQEQVAIYDPLCT